MENDKRFTVSIDLELRDKFLIYCIQNKLKKSKVIEMLIKEYLKEKS